jgi:dihydrofolate synthase/folylpolyglutamate synthase
MLDTCLDPKAYQDALDFLFGRIDYERATVIAYDRREFRLDRMRELLRRLDNPHDAFAIVHVAGTKGKGSTAAMIAAVLTAAGYRTGLYSSPHLDRIEERMAVDGRPCAAADFVDLLECVRPIVEAMDQRAGSTNSAGRPTYFEVTTAMALLGFARRHVDAAVVEVGLGGRLDSTNVCQPAVSVITSISFDHMKQLGNTLTSIAREKAGIIKPGVPVVCGVMDREPQAVIEQTARQRCCTLAQLGEHFDLMYVAPHNLQDDADRARMNFVSRVSGQEHRYDGLELSLVGRHQAANAAVALAALAQLRARGWAIPEAAVREGLAGVEWPARVEVVARRPAVIVDAAHNAASIASLLETLGESFSAQRRWLIFATTQDKPVREMLAHLLPHFDGVVLTRYLNNPRYVPVDELARHVAQIVSESNGSVGKHDADWLHCCESPAEAWQRVRGLASPADLICVTGSFFLAAEMRAMIPRDGQRSCLKT